MAKGTFEYSFRGELWKYPGKGGWFFISLPQKLSSKIRQSFGEAETGWGRLPAEVALGESSWETSIWFDLKAGGYLLPIKKKVRDREQLVAQKKYKVRLQIKVVGHDLDFLD